MKGFISTASLALVGRARSIFVCLALVGVAVIAYAHRVHVVPWLPYLLLLACPLAHLFMFHGHGGGGHGYEREREIVRLPPPASREPHDA
jgi:hypothetical protein